MPSVETPVIPAHPGELVLLSLTGSHAYGLERPESDVDFRGVYACPSDAMLGLRPPQDTVDVQHPDVTLHELRKFCKLAAAANPTVLETLWAPPVVRTPLGDALLNNRAMFLSRRARNTYGGYARQQMVKAARGTGGSRGVEHYKRTKFVLHLLRLLEAGLHLLETGDVLVRVDDPERLRAMAEWPLEAVAEHVERMEAAINAAVPDSPLPAEPDHDAIDRTMAWIRGQLL